jgi:hypothetical protein
VIVVSYGTDRISSEDSNVNKMVARRNPDEVRQTHPISGYALGWFFRGEEQSNNVWRIDGTYLWGHTVSTVDCDYDRALKWCVAQREHINAQLFGQLPVPSPGTPGEG